MIAAHLGGDGPWWIGGRLQVLPLKDACCDLVLAVTVLCFLPAAEAKKAMAEIARVLKPGGRLILGELSPYSMWALRRRLRGWFGASLWRKARFRRPNALETLALEAGLQIEAMRGAVFYPPWRWAARRMAAWERFLSNHTTIGAAFLVLVSSKPLRTNEKRTVPEIPEKFLFGQATMAFDSWC